ncbi:hypothetical protein OG394_00510 [Kribbella sp. NBC_01245]|uniref:hypothetical protein n=1 Tax=Kribbella sp. NBC_01245 TaxID=2903578 RepID=UPI002E2B3260|nr:hypothetical protein [Kribbella sp. NBC_01245]
MKLTITISGDEVAISSDSTTATSQSAAPAGPQIFDGGPVPEVLLSMESQVAAGHLAPPSGWGH